MSRREERPTVLVVDDDARLAEAIQVWLDREGFHVETASDGVEAFELLKSPHCKCMLLDINMPRINGIELLLLMQAEGIHVPTIIMAGFQDFDEEEMKQFENVVGFFQKPFDMNRMLAAIRDCDGAGAGKPKQG